MVTGTVEPAKFSRGLEGVIASQTSISVVDGKTGVLLYRGIPVAELAEKSSFEETACMLLEGALPNRARLDAFRDDIRAQQALPAKVVDLLRLVPRDANPMSVLRTAVSFLGTLSAENEDVSDINKTDRTRLDREIVKCRRLIARFATVVCAFHRIRSGLEPIAPDPKLSLAANFLYMMNGKRPTPGMERAFDLCLILHAEHGFNASTFSARVTIATLSDLHSAITSAIGTLKGPLHGGANEQVMVMLDEIGSPEKAAEWVKSALTTGKKVMGFGHRIYKVYDPRARILKDWSRKLGEERGEPKWFRMSEIVEKTVKETKNIDPNVDFYSATVYHHLGIPRDLFTPIFAVSRIAGWCAHCVEQLSDNRLYRPESEYVGPRDVTVLPIDKR